MIDQEVLEDIHCYQNSFTKKQILFKWKKISQRTKAAYQLSSYEKERFLKEAFEEVRGLIYESYCEDFEHDLTEVQLHGWISHCGWVANELGQLARERASISVSHLQ